MPVVARTVILLVFSNIFMTLSVFVPFAALYMKEPVRLNYLWAALCMCGAVYFVFRR
jgi:uncharacterized protein (DUF486 family)